LNDFQVDATLDKKNRKIKSEEKVPSPFSLCFSFPVFSRIAAGCSFLFYSKAETETEKESKV